MTRDRASAVTICFPGRWTIFKVYCCNRKIQRAIRPCGSGLDNSHNKLAWSVMMVNVSTPSRYERDFSVNVITAKHSRSVAE